MVKTDIMPEYTDDKEVFAAIEQQIALNNPPPAEFLDAVVTGKLKLPDYLIEKMEKRGWVRRCEVWSRVMGYLRPVREWNKGKREEHKERHMLSPGDLTDVKEHK